MSWNHRIVKRRCEAMKEDYFEVVEAYYFKDNGASGKPIKKVKTFTTNGIAPMGNSLKDLRWALKKMLEALDLVIKDESFLIDDTKKSKKPKKIK